MQSVIAQNIAMRHIPVRTHNNFIFACAYNYFIFICVFKPRTYSVRVSLAELL